MQLGLAAEALFLPWKLERNFNENVKQQSKNTQKTNKLRFNNQQHDKQCITASAFGFEGSVAQGLFNLR